MMSVYQMTTTMRSMEQNMIQLRRGMEWEGQLREDQDADGVPDVEDANPASGNHAGTLNPV